MGNMRNIGIAYCCEKIESEEETLSRILSSMKLSELETENVYKEFLEILQEKRIDRKLLNPFLNRIIGKSLYANVQKDFANELLKDSEFYKDVKKLGIMVIVYSKNTQDDIIKIEFMTSHFLTFYLDECFDLHLSLSRISNLSLKIEEFIKDVIEINTRNILLACKNYLSWEKVLHLNEIWSFYRKKFLFKMIKANFENIIHRYANIKNQIKNNRLDEIEELDKENHKTEINVKNNEMKDLNNKDIKLEIKTIEEIIKEFFRTSLPYMKGEYIWNFLYDQYMLEKKSEKD